MGLLGSDTFWKNCEVSIKLQWCEFERTCVSLQPHSEEMDLTQRFRRHRVSKWLVLRFQKGMLFPIFEAQCSRLHLIPLGCEPPLTRCLGYLDALLLCMPPLDSRHGSPVGISLYMHECVSRQEQWSGLPFPSPMRACTLSLFSRVQPFATLWAGALQAPLSTGFARQEYWSGSPFPSPWLVPTPFSIDK